ncbi:DUF1501 domain-containing protein, partial [Brasilonema octagenarum UFV-OR1]|nr:DUF1501 domain-containing protein [Brasilonema octagenarum UFV-OR1]
MEMNLIQALQMPGTRREWLRRSGTGIGSLALAGALADAYGLAPSAEAAATVSPMLPHQPHFTGKAKHIIHVFCNGGPSHVDTFDPKPKLNEFH